jgi:hypothetical protein
VAVLVFSTEVKLWSRFNEVRTLWFALSIFCQTACLFFSASCAADALQRCQSL